MNRGSEWRIWDLHVHTPLSIENNYGCANDEEGWNKYITALEQLPSDIKVLGINDYLFIDGYKKVKEYKDSGRLSNIELLLPVVEFRLAKFCGHKQFKRINFHVIFSNEVSADVIQYQFLNALSSNYTLSTDCIQQWGGVVTMENLEDLGRRIINSVPEEQKHNYGSPLKEGFNNLNLELSQIITILNNAPQYFKGKYLTAIGKTEWDEFKWDDTSIAEKKTIINQADIVFTAAENIEKFNNAKVKLQEQNVNSLLLDCSDAHSFADTSTKDRLGNCKTWIKADPTFEGLKQIIFEPEDRVRICDSKPEYKYDYDVIDRVELNSANTWHQTIYLNQNLNSIIGGRSTGKSTLLASLAASFNCIDDVDNKEYINQLRDSVHIYWRDGQENGDKYIEYFPQNKISKVAEPQETDKLLMDILLGKEDVKVEYDKHKSLLASRFSTIQANVALYFEKRRLYIEKKQYIKGIRIIFDNLTLSLMMEVNVEQFSKVLAGILKNSMYALLKKSETVTFSPEIFLGLKVNKDMLEITIRDNGSGIDENIKDKIFAPFFTTKTTGEAAGVGLYLCREIVQNHRGTIEVESKKGEYTQFLITIPVYQPKTITPPKEEE